MTPARGVTTIDGLARFARRRIIARTSGAMSPSCIVVTPLAGVMAAGRHGRGASWTWGIMDVGRHSQKSNPHPLFFQPLQKTKYFDTLYYDKRPVGSCCFTA